MSTLIDRPPPPVRSQPGGEDWAELATLEDGREADDLTEALARERIETRTLPMPVTRRRFPRHLRDGAAVTVRYVYVILVRAPWLDEARALFTRWLRNRRAQLRRATRRALLVLALTIALAVGLGAGLVAQEEDRDPPGRPGGPAPRVPGYAPAWSVASTADDGREALEHATAEPFVPVDEPLRFPPHRVR